MLKGKFFTSRKIAISWFIIMTGLFFIPGTALPKKQLDLPLDKLIHIGFFALLLFLWRSAFSSGKKFYNTYLFIAAVVYGLLIEILQGLIVPQRSFDIYDLYADAFGALLGLLVWMGVYKKNKPL
jgi:VanZ family protein